LQIWSVERPHDQQCPLAHMEALLYHHILIHCQCIHHQLASGRKMGLAPCGTSQVLWQVITLIFKAFKHVVFKLLLIIERLLGHYAFDLVSPW
jgi:hypothetical protein